MTRTEKRPGSPCTLPCRLGGGQPSYHDERAEWLVYCYDATERPKVGIRKRDWQAVAPTQEGVLREMARRLREIGEGRLPK